MEGTSVAEVTVGGIFEQAGETMSGIVDMSTNFFNSLWANPMGKLIITLGLVGAGIGLCFKLFLKKKHV